jgi:hypothetical protein
MKRIIFLVLSILCIANAATFVGYRGGYAGNSATVSTSTTIDLLENDLLMVAVKWEDGAATPTVSDGGTRVFTMEDGASQSGEVFTRMGYLVVSAAQAGNGVYFTAVMGATRQTSTIMLYSFRFAAGAPTRLAYSSAAGNGTACASSAVSPTGTDIAVMGVANCYNGSISSPLIGGSAATGNNSSNAYSLAFYSTYSSNQANITAAATCASGSWVGSIMAFGTGGGCTPGDATQYGNVIDTVGNAKRWLLPVSGTNDSVGRYGTWPDSTAFVSATANDSMAARWKAKFTKAAVHWYSKSCTGAGADIDTVHDTITIVGTVPAYTNAPFSFPEDQAISTQNITSMAGVDSVVARTPLPAGLSLNKTTGAITGTPTTVQEAGNVLFVTYNNDYPVDSANISFTITAAASPISASGAVAAQSSSISGSGTVVIAATGSVSAQSSTTSATGITRVVTITDVRPDSVYVAQNDTIEGSAFGATQGASTILIDGSAPTVVSWSDTRIVYVMPDIVAGWADITVSDTYTSDADSAYCRGSYPSSNVSGAVSAQYSTASGAGTSILAITGALAAQGSSVASTASVGTSVNGSVVSQSSSSSGAIASVISFLGNAISQNSTTEAAASNPLDVSGTLQAQSSSVYGFFGQGPVTLSGDISAQGSAAEGAFEGIVSVIGSMVASSSSTSGAIAVASSVIGSLQCQYSSTSGAFTSSIAAACSAVARASTVAGRLGDAIKTGVSASRWSSWRQLWKKGWK